MGISAALLPEFDRETGVTRRLLERVPDDQLTWKPHEKSMPLGRLAEHLSDVVGWVVVTIQDSGVEMGGAPRDWTPTPRQEILARFDRNVAAARAALKDRTDAELMAPWTLSSDGKEVFSMPKAAVLRGFVFNHLVHHRGQLSVYLRMQNVAIPSIYGPSGDEPM
jgi:uncharacterized damage-inducible protein DinB